MSILMDLNKVFQPISTLRPSQVTQSSTAQNWKVMDNNQWSEVQDQLSGKITNIPFNEQKLCFLTQIRKWREELPYCNYWYVFEFFPQHLKHKTFQSYEEWNANRMMKLLGMRNFQVCLVELKECVIMNMLLFKLIII